MFKRLKSKFIDDASLPQTKNGFFLNVRCDICGEEFNLFINLSTDLIQNFNDPGGVTYSLRKEVIGSLCRNAIHVRMEFDGSKRFVSKEIENGTFIQKKR